MRLSNLSYFIREGVENIFLHGFISFAAITLIAACLIIMGSFGLVAQNISVAIGNVERDNEIVLFIDANLSDAQALAVDAKLRAVKNVKDVIFVSKDEALDDYKDRLGADADILEGLDEDNPLRHSYRVLIEEIDLYEQTSKQLESVGGVAKVNARNDVVQQLFNLRGVMLAVAMTFIGILGAVSVFIISNAIRLAAFARRDEMAIMKMVGATNGFIRASFLVEGLFLGLVAAAVAFFLQWGLYEEFLAPAIMGTPLITAIPYGDVSHYVFIAFFGVGFVVGFGGSFISIGKYLKV